MDLKIQETPLRKIDSIYFKLEYKNPTGSVKDRGIPFQIEKATEKGFTKFVISSSGNAAISAAYWIKKISGDLAVFVSPSVSKGKLEKLRFGGSKIFVDKKTISGAIKYAKRYGAFNLRASTDPSGFVGYKNLAIEIIKQQGKVGSVFIPVSSGTLCYGVIKGFDELGLAPQIHAVQTTSCNLISSRFDKDFERTDGSLADALVAKTSVLKNSLVDSIKLSKGFGWVVDDDELIKAWNYLRDHKIITSFEGAATLAAVWKAKEKNFKLEEPVVCLLTGKYYK